MSIEAKYIKVITDVGLSENQARVYLANLQLGSARPVDIAKKAEIKRPTVYPVLESLVSMGLITSDPSSFKNKYIAERPIKLQSIVERKQQELNNSLSEIDALAGLKSDKQILKYYEGSQSIKAIFADMLKIVRPKDKYYIISNLGGWHELDPKFMDWFIEERAKLDLDIRCILWDSKVARDYISNEKEYNLKVKMLYNQTSFSGNMVIVPSRVFLSHTLNPVWGTTIEHPNIVKFYQDLFESWWDSLP